MAHGVGVSRIGAGVHLRPQEREGRAHATVLMTHRAGRR